MIGKLIATTIGPRAAMVLALLSAGIVAAHAGHLDAQDAIAISEQAIGRGVGPHDLIDSNGIAFSLASYRGKPVIINIVYSSCSSICPPTTQHLLAAVKEARRVIGLDRFAVLTIGFDARHDTPTRMAQFAAAQGIALPNWRLASGEQGSLDALLGDLGFSYGAAAGGFEHIEQTTIIDRDGRVYRQVYGDDFPLQVLLEPLKDVVYGRDAPLSLGGLIDRIKFICTTYDPGAGHYRLAYGELVGGVIAAASLLLFGAVLLREWVRAARA
jgi:protein SCO1